MCGFAGFIDYRGLGDLSLVQAMADTLQHRGPDDGGYEIISHPPVSIGFGFRRLSIIDLSPAGHQPMFSKDGSVCVMLNGEIYNYRELRSELEKEGIVFRSGSDTEVVIESYIKYGADAVHRFIGMFAIALYDLKKGQVRLFRDRAGVKPLFYHVHANGFLFASELKAFHKHPDFRKRINAVALQTYFFNGNIPAPDTIFENTFKVEPGSFLTLNLSDGVYTVTKYWDVFDAYNRERADVSYGEALHETEKLMSSAFNYRMVADVPVGVFLSGGYDSTAVAALLSQHSSGLNTFTIGFSEKNYDESKFAAAVAAHLGTRHHEFTCTINEAITILPELPVIYDEPFGDSSAIPTTLVSRIARKHVKVALSADAGDELFAGYPRHKKVKRYLERFAHIPGSLSVAVAAALSAVKGLNPSISTPDRFEKLRLLLAGEGDLLRFHIINQTYTGKEIHRLLRHKYPFAHLPFDEDKLLHTGVETLNKILAVEYKTYLTDDILQKVDRATMSASLEGREPFLDHRLVEWLAVLPAAFKYDGHTSKKLLKDIVHKYVPVELMERPKMGFGVPVSAWLRNELKDLFHEVMDEKFIRNQDLLNEKLVLELKADFLSGKLQDFERLWFVFVFLQWFKKWM